MGVQITEEIKTAYDTWMKAEGKVPDYEYMKGYKSRTAAAFRLYKVFAALCANAGLKPVKTAHELNEPFTFKT